MVRHAPPDDGSPTRLIATMVGIVGILLLGSLAWSAVGALFSALGEATAVFTTARPTPIKLVAVVGTGTAGPTTQAARPTGTPAAVAAAQLTATPIAPAAAAAATPSPPSPTDIPTAQPTPEATAALGPSPTDVPSGRAPWVLLPLPAPEGHVAPGALVVEARARGDAPITAIHLELDGAALAVTLEQKSDSTWRGSANTKVAAGHHAARATVVDDQGRSGSFRWSFDASP